MTKQHRVSLSQKKYKPITQKQESSHNKFWGFCISEGIRWVLAYYLFYTCRPICILARMDSLA